MKRIPPVNSAPEEVVEREIILDPPPKDAPFEETCAHVLAELERHQQVLHKVAEEELKNCALHKLSRASHKKCNEGSQEFLNILWKARCIGLSRLYGAAIVTFAVAMIEKGN